MNVKEGGKGGGIPLVVWYHEISRIAGGKYCKLLANTRTRAPSRARARIRDTWRETRNALLPIRFNFGIARLFRNRCEFGDSRREAEMFKSCPASTRETRTNLVATREPTRTWKGHGNKISRSISRDCQRFESKLTRPSTFARVTSGYTISALRI